MLIVIAVDTSVPIDVPDDWSGVERLLGDITDANKKGMTSVVIKEVDFGTLNWKAQSKNFDQFQEYWVNVANDLTGLAPVALKELQRRCKDAWNIGWSLGRFDFYRKVFGKSV